MFKELLVIGAVVAFGLLSYVLIEFGGRLFLTLESCHAVDGDTVVCSGKRYRLRGIDAPELAQPLGPEAKWLLQAFLDASGARCKATGSADRYGRPLADCWSLRRVQDSLLEEGLALHYRRFDNDSDLIWAESEADGRRLGLWAGQFRVPCEYRRLKEAAPLRDRTTIHLARCLYP